MDGGAGEVAMSVSQTRAGSRPFLPTWELAVSAEFSIKIYRVVFLSDLVRSCHPLLSGAAFTFVTGFGPLIFL